jgi:hypothetical protein
MKTLNWTVETLGGECNLSGFCVHLLKVKVAEMKIVSDM